MNNYDFNYNGDMIEKQNDKKRLILHLVGLKWMNFLLIGFTIFQNLFFSGFSVITILLSIYVLYVSFLFISLARKDSLIVEFEYNDILTRASSLNFYLNIAILFSVIDAIYSCIVNKSFIVDLLYSENSFEKNYGLFIIYTLVLRIIYLTFLRIYNRLDDEFQI
jgi:hypothetical protein